MAQLLQAPVVVVVAVVVRILQGTAMIASMKTRWVGARVCLRVRVRACACARVCACVRVIIGVLKRWESHER